VHAPTSIILTPTPVNIAITSRAPRLMLSTTCIDVVPGLFQFGSLFLSVDLSYKLKFGIVGQRDDL
jgi:hypothetical protein